MYTAVVTQGEKNRGELTTNRCLPFFPRGNNPSVPLCETVDTCCSARGGSCHRGSVAMVVMFISLSMGLDLSLYTSTSFAHLCPIHGRLPRGLDRVSRSTV